MFFDRRSGAKNIREAAFDAGYPDETVFNNTL
jgi:hypothetical protein